VTIRKIKTTISTSINEMMITDGIRLRLEEENCMAG